MPDGKLTPQLLGIVSGNTPDAPIEVVIELVVKPPAAVATASRAEKIAQQRQDFLDVCAPIERRIEHLGGEVLDHAWINQTLRARVTPGALRELATADDVVSIDVPGRMSRE